MTALMTTLLLVAEAGPGFTGHHRAVPNVACCDVCGVESARVAVLLQRLSGCPRWRDRDNAAHALRKFDWRCHPEIALSLASSMLCDREEEVREEAAESLAKLKPCLPEVHAALARSARCDPDHATRKWARRGLNAIGDRCVAQCGVCGIDNTLPAHYVVPVPSRGPVLVEPSYEPPIAPPVDELMPPSELPIVPEARPPFVDPSARRVPDDRSAERRPEPRSRPRLVLGRFLRPGAAR
jgi:hypothetical protein